MKENVTRTISETLDDLAKRGFDQTFEPAKPYIKSTETGRLFTTAELSIVDVYRFEGETDPQDMAVVYAVEATNGDRGTIVDAFGAYGRADLGTILAQMRQLKRHDDGAMGAHS